MALIIDMPGRRDEYILKADRESSQPTVFELRPLSWEEQEEVMALSPTTPVQAVQIAAIAAAARAEKRELTAEESARITEITSADTGYMRKLTKYLATAARLGLTGIRGAVGKDGNPVQVSPPDFTRHAPVEALREIGARVLEISRLSEDIIKK